MKRDMLHDLSLWKDSSRRKPLILEGARQVGKTWLVKDFASRHYKNMAYINFEKEIALRNLFRDDYDISRILSNISAATHQTIIPGETLIFLDELQEAENSLTALKYFAEDAPEQHVIAAGSLLGIELHKSTSFPVGKVQFKTLRPMSFMEFLEATGDSILREYIENGDSSSISLFASKYTERLKQYYYVGGMPEAVEEFTISGDWQVVREIQDDILKSYEMDFSKHAPAEIVPRIRQLWRSLPSQLSKENKKFIYGLVREGARAREYEIALQWLLDSGLVAKVNNVTAPRIPLRSYEDAKAFKLFILDTGLLGALSGLDSATIVEGNRVFTEFKGALTEQFVFQQLQIKHEPYYYAKTGGMEIDFIIQKEGNVIPIEVKAEENIKAKSLWAFRKEYHPELAYRLSMKGWEIQNDLVNLPLYMTSTI